MRFLIIFFVPLLLLGTVASQTPIPDSSLCKKLLCFHGGICRKDLSGNEFCECSSPQFFGDECQRIKDDPCLINHCQNGAPCFATDDYNSYTCECPKGFGGRYCEIEVRREEENCLKKSGNGFCDLECNSAPYDWDGGDCTTEKKKEEEKLAADSLIPSLIIDPQSFAPKPDSSLCKKLLCLHDGICRKDLSGNEFCECSSPQFFGDACQGIKDNPCLTNHCQNGAPCFATDDYNSYTCECPKGFGGRYCEIEVQREEYCLGKSGDGFCDLECNSAPYDWDGGDCTAEKNVVKGVLTADSLVRSLITDPQNFVSEVAPKLSVKSKESSNAVVLFCLGLLIAMILVVAIVNIASRETRRRKVKVNVRSTFIPENESSWLLPATLAPAHFIVDESMDNGFQEELENDQPPRIFTKLHELAASGNAITNQEIKELSMCAALKDSINGQTCIHWAVLSPENASEETVVENIQKLVYFGCPIEAQDDSGSTALHLAIRNGRMEVAKYLLDKINPNIQDNDGRTALFDAVCIKSLEMVQRILDSRINIDVNALAYTNDTALFKACRIDVNGDTLPIVRALLRKGAH